MPAGLVLQSAALLVMLVLAPATEARAMQITSSAFAANGKIPRNVHVRGKTSHRHCMVGGSG